MRVRKKHRGSEGLSGSMRARAGFEGSRGFWGSAWVLRVCVGFWGFGEAAGDCSRAGRACLYIPVAVTIISLINYQLYKIKCPGHAYIDTDAGCMMHGHNKQTPQLSIKMIPVAIPFVLWILATPFCCCVQCDVHHGLQNIVRSHALPLKVVN